ncbi:uncharacterized protein L969DRAFT_185619 [Mixia osmundae IAM 14324]|uniref:DUF2415 domain-containing protein n=1 Tax=Mixia osmundae (strain CBS 9802 / IAM 14324 / JCM 22182 / KY 12970) TaxID=764103 RepID=G7DT88_MIXOS|nr:uncharacterized protein L969DRAFT_185619 [Mixia osmundae IAM 14324]KEI42927.1 hypothetical protein L969DRAFT_185619 [Mixia osmundae IAM 14324]GAA93735.1 hypothetical protein E5Q_00381 [Mixia osmundae IAM 14324]
MTRRRSEMATSGQTSWRAGSPLKLARPTFERVMCCLPVRTTIIHPQLRDLLICPRQAGEIYNVTLSSIVRHADMGSTHPSQSNFVTAAFVPNCLTKGCGLIAAGGQHSQIIIRSDDPHSSWAIKETLSGSINNSICIAPSALPSEVPQAIVSNNDNCIAIFDITWASRHLEAARDSTQESDGDDERRPTRSARSAKKSLSRAYRGRSAPALLRRQNLHFDTPINHSSVSPDGKTMVSVGDSTEMFVCDISAANQFSLMTKRPCAQDASFSTSWSRDSRTFAIASQDCSVAFYDVRNLDRPINRFRTSAPARLVKHSGASHELTAFSEQYDVVHVIDSKTVEHLGQLTIDPGASTAPLRPGLSLAEERDALAAVCPEGISPQAWIDGLSQYTNGLEFDSVTDCDAAVNIVGLDWSPDGEALYVASLSGVCEYRVDQAARQSAVHFELL